jgi:deoxyribose-phosphate aldolase
MLSERGREIAAIIDHTLLKANATPEQIRELCAEARDYGFYAVCVNPYYVRLASESLAGSPVHVVAVAGFPLGAGVSEAKAFEARRSIADGADEIDMVLNVGALKAGEFEVVEGDIAAVVAACHEGGAICKVIIETGYLSDAEKIEALGLEGPRRPTSH